MHGCSNLNFRFQILLSLLLLDGFVLPECLAGWTCLVDDLSLFHWCSGF